MNDLIAENVFKALKMHRILLESSLYLEIRGKNVAYAMDFVIIQILNDDKERSKMIGW